MKMGFVDVNVRGCIWMKVSEKDNRSVSIKELEDEIDRITPEHIDTVANNYLRGRYEVMNDLVRWLHGRK